jgi:hypothetical protein
MQLNRDTLAELHMLLTSSSYLIVHVTFRLMQLENLEKETIKWCREILRNSPTAIRVLKAAINAVDDGHAGLQVYYSYSFFLVVMLVFRQITMHNYIDIPCYIPNEFQSSILIQLGILFFVKKTWYFIF